MGVEWGGTPPGGGGDAGYQMFFSGCLSRCYSFRGFEMRGRCGFHGEVARSKVSILGIKQPPPLCGSGVCVGKEGGGDFQ